MATRRSTPLVTASLVVLAIAGCGGSSSPSTASHVPVRASNAAIQSPAASPTPTPAPTPVPLSAPLLLQVENLAAARPQSGLSTANIVYEYDTEGGISRFTGIWFTPPPTADQVGPVRSARLVSIRLLRIYGGVLLYSGASNYTQAELRASGLRYYNPDDAVIGSTVLYRIRSRSAPHNLYSNGSELASFEQKVGMGDVSYQLWQRTEVANLPAGGTPASSFQVPLTQAEKPIFTYDPSQGAYQRDEPGGGGYAATGTLDDADTGQPWMVPNVVVLQVPMTTVTQDDENSSNYPWIDGLDFDISGSGTGQLAVGGQLYDIDWSQGASGPPQLTLTDGQTAPLAPGQVLFELVSQGSAVTVQP